MKQSEKIKVVVVLGPTSSGKSNLAIELAKEYNGEVISADSRQIYQAMNLGTGKVEGEWKKISQKEQAFFSEGIAHHLIDFISPSQEYNVSQFQKDCLLKIEEVAERGKLPIICGGSTFWIDAVVEGIILPPVKPNRKLREELSEKTSAGLFEKLKKLDSKRAETIDSKNKVRLIRAIEICLALGKVPQKSNTKNENLEFLEIGIKLPKEKLATKIKKRLESRWLAGMIKEVENLKKNHGLSWEKIAAFGLAYYWIPQYLKEEIDLSELKERVFLAEKNYAKRQMTWLKKKKNIRWVKSLADASELVKKFLN